MSPITHLVKKKRYISPMVQVFKCLLKNMWFKIGMMFKTINGGQTEVEPTPSSPTIIDISDSQGRFSGQAILNNRWVSNF